MCVRVCIERGREIRPKSKNYHNRLVPNKLQSDLCTFHRLGVADYIHVLYFICKLCSVFSACEPSVKISHVVTNHEM